MCLDQDCAVVAALLSHPSTPFLSLMILELDVGKVSPLPANIEQEEEASLSGTLPLCPGARAHRMPQNMHTSESQSEHLAGGFQSLAGTLQVAC